MLRCLRPVGRGRIPRSPHAALAVADPWSPSPLTWPQGCWGSTSAVPKRKRRKKAAISLKRGPLVAVAETKEDADNTLARETIVSAISATEKQMAVLEEEMDPHPNKSKLSRRLRRADTFLHRIPKIDTSFEKDFMERSFRFPYIVQEAMRIETDAMKAAVWQNFLKKEERLTPENDAEVQLETQRGLESVRMKYYDLTHTLRKGKRKARKKAVQDLHRVLSKKDTFNPQIASQIEDMAKMLPPEAYAYYQHLKEKNLPVELTKDEMQLLDTLAPEVDSIKRKNQRERRRAQAKAFRDPDLQDPLVQEELGRHSVLDQMKVADELESDRVRAERRSDGPDGLKHHKKFAEMDKHGPSEKPEDQDAVLEWLYDHMESARTEQMKERRHEGDRIEEERRQAGRAPTPFGMLDNMTEDEKLGHAAQELRRLFDYEIRQDPDFVEALSFATNTDVRGALLGEQAEEVAAAALHPNLADESIGLTNIYRKMVT